MSEFSVGIFSWRRELSNEWRSKLDLGSSESVAPICKKESWKLDG